MQALIAPLAVITDRAGFIDLHTSAAGPFLMDYEAGFSAAYHGEPRTIRGFCHPCGAESDLVIDMHWGGKDVEGRFVPNWRERLACPTCGLNNRQRLIATLLIERMNARPDLRVYFMEQVTPIFALFTARYPEAEVIGSEYLGEHPGGTTIDGIRHESVEALSFASGSLDLIVSNDVFEHVPDPLQGFRECHRVLKPGGEMLATFPFYPWVETSVTRARLGPGGIEHLHPPMYHGNPVSDDGALVFTDFSWDLIEVIRAAGFPDPVIELYRSVRFGHVGGLQMVFRLCKPG